MSVDALENNTFAVYKHQAVLHLHGPKTYMLRDILDQPAFLVIYQDLKIIEIRYLRAPFSDILDNTAYFGSCFDRNA